MKTMEYDSLTFFKGSDNLDDYFLAVTRNGQLLYSTAEKSNTPSFDWKLVSIDEAALRVLH